jgi:hypothetical protein
MVAIDFTYRGQSRTLYVKQESLTVFPDSNKKYLTTDLLRIEPVRDGYLSPDVEIEGFRALGRVCAMCIDQPSPATG